MVLHGLTTLLKCLLSVFFKTIYTFSDIKNTEISPTFLCMEIILRDSSDELLSFVDYNMKSNNILNIYLLYTVSEE